MFHGLTRARARFMQALYRLIDKDPRFHALQRRRGRFAWSLAGIVVAAYYSFVLIIAFAPELLARPLHAGTVVTVGVASGLALIVLCIAITGIYIVRANREFDALNRAIVADARAHAP
jgi:uncharacterized membrane protein (DUF485 family)